MSGDVHGEVHLVHSGWRGTTEWEEARQWFVRNWEVAFAELERQCEA